MEKVCAFAPATIANLSVGFDVLGLALSGIGDKVELTRNTLGHHRITEIVSDVDLPYDIHKNACSAVVMAMQKEMGADIFVDISIKKGFKAGSGLGSSAASSVAAAVAFNKMLGNPFSKQALLKFTTEGERTACGSPIYDNVSASLFGGLVLMHQEKAIALPIPQDLHVLAYFQQIEIKTKDARDILPPKVSVKTATHQMANLAMFIHALHVKDLVHFKTSMQDELAEPYRRKLIPHYTEFEEIAENFNALSFGISGSGPTVYALTKDRNNAERIQAEFDKITKNEAFESISFIENLNDNKQGAFVCDC